MKYGMRKPSISKSIKARTTGRINRTINRSINPLYGKKGMGYINNPKKALYNKVYNKTTVGVNDMFINTSNNTSSNCYVSNTLKEKNKWISIFLCIFTLCGHKFYEGKIGLGILYLLTIGLFGIGWFVDLIILLTKPNTYYV